MVMEDTLLPQYGGQIACAAPSGACQTFSFFHAR